MLKCSDKVRSWICRSLKIVDSITVAFQGVAAATGRLERGESQRFSRQSLKDEHHLETLLRSIQSSPYTPHISLHFFCSSHVDDSNMRHLCCVVHDSLPRVVHEKINVSVVKTSNYIPVKFNIPAAIPTQKKKLCYFPINPRGSMQDVSVYLEKLFTVK